MIWDTGRNKENGIFDHFLYLYYLISLATALGMELLEDACNVCVVHAMPVLTNQQCLVVRKDFLFEKWTIAKEAKSQPVSWKYFLQWKGYHLSFGIFFFFILTKYWCLNQLYKSVFQSSKQHLKVFVFYSLFPVRMFWMSDRRVTERKQSTLRGDSHIVLLV